MPVNQLLKRKFTPFLPFFQLPYPPRVMFLERQSLDSVTSFVFLSHSHRESGLLDPAVASFVKMLDVECRLVHFSSVMRVFR